jgi:hypothetical protein
MEGGEISRLTPPPSLPLGVGSGRLHDGQIGFTPTCRYGNRGDHEDRAEGRNGNDHARGRPEGRKDAGRQTTRGLPVALSIARNTGAGWAQ